MIGPLKFDMFTAAMFFFSVRFLEQYFISFDGLAHLDWHFVEMDQHAYWADLEWWLQAGSVPCDRKFPYKWNLSVFKAVPPNRLPFYLGSLLHIICSLFSHFCKKCSSYGFEILTPLFTKCSFHWLQHFFFSNFSHLFELIFAS